MSLNNQLDPEKIIRTVNKLEMRIADRFPESGLRKAVGNLLTLTKNSKENIEWVSKPNIPLRIFAYGLIITALIGLVFSVTFIELKIENTTLGNVVGITEAIFNDIVLLGAAVFFLVTIETRVKRKRTIKSLHELRVIAHVIDMHQLTKDPNLILSKNFNTVNSPKRTLTRFELQRYLDYCSEAHALIAKVAALYSQSLPDEVIVRSVNEIEVLTTGLSRKIYQKIVILNNLPIDNDHVDVTPPLA